MKANEAPKKIYLDPKKVEESEFGIIDAIVPEHRVEKGDIEYIRKDAFIEKAKVFLWTHIDGTDYHVNYILKEFEKYMKKGK